MYDRRRKNGRREVTHSSIDYALILMLLVTGKTSGAVPEGGGDERGKEEKGRGEEARWVRRKRRNLGREARQIDRQV